MIYNVENIIWKNAEQSVPKNSAAAPDEIAIKLINQMGPQVEAQLTGSIEQLLKQGQFEPIGAKAG